MRDQELIWRSAAARRDELDPKAVDALRILCQLADSYDIEHAIIESPSRGFLEDHLGFTELHRPAVDLRPLRGSHHPDPSGRFPTVPTRTGEQAPESHPIVGSKSEFDDFVAGTREVRPRHEGERSPDLLHALQPSSPVGWLEQERMNGLGSAHELRDAARGELVTERKIADFRPDLGFARTVPKNSSGAPCASKRCPTAVCDARSKRAVITCPQTANVSFSWLGSEEEPIVWPPGTPGWRPLPTPRRAFSDGSATRS